MRISVTKARTALSALLNHVQNPNQVVVLTRHDKAIGALVSMANLERIWQIEDEQDFGKIRQPLTGYGHTIGDAMTSGRNGKITTKRHAALELRTLQLTRAEERRILREGGLKPVEGGELAEEREVVVEPVRKWWWFWRAASRT